MLKVILIGGFVLFLILFIITFILGIKNIKKKNDSCKKCGAKTEKKEKFCSKCGNKIHSKKPLIYFAISFISLVMILGFTALGILNRNIFRKDIIITSSNSNERNELAAQIEIITEYIKIRERKSTSSNVLGKVYKGEIYNIISEDEDSYYNWYEIETSNGTKGYIAGKNGITAYVVELPIKGLESIIDENNKTTSTTTTTKTTTKKKTTKKTTTNKTTNTTTTTKANTITQTTTTKANTTTTTTQQVTKKVIDAKVNYSCSRGELNYKNECVYENYTSDPSIKYIICPSGYELEKEGSVFCVTNTDPVDATEKTGCSNGDSNLEYINGQYFCRGGQVVVKHVCPSGYRLQSINVGVVTSYYCSSTKSGTVRGTEACRDGYKLNSSGKLCYKEIKKEPTITYTCPTGYELKEDKCYEM